MSFNSIARTAVSGLDVEQTRLTVSAGNVANQNTPGYRAGPGASDDRSFVMMLLMITAPEVGIISILSASASCFTIAIIGCIALKNSGPQHQRHYHSMLASS